MVIEIFKFENRTSDGEIFLPIGRDDSPVYFSYSTHSARKNEFIGPTINHVCDQKRRDRKQFTSNELSYDENGVGQKVLKMCK